MIIELDKGHSIHRKGDREGEIEVKEFIVNGAWNVEKMRSYVSKEMTSHFIENIKPNINVESIDKAW